MCIKIAFLQKEKKKSMLKKDRADRLRYPPTPCTPNFVVSSPRYECNKELFLFPQFDGMHLS